MGTVNKTWHVVVYVMKIWWCSFLCSWQLGVHGYSQQDVACGGIYNEDMVVLIFVQLAAWCTWVQSARRGMWWYM